MKPASPVKDRFMSHVSPEPNTGCWLWSGNTDSKGYGRFGMRRNGAWGARLAHRVSLELFVGPMPDGLVADHLCRVTCCVNPDHLEAVTMRENTVRGLAPGIVAARQRDKTHCPKGHSYLDPDNVRIRPNGWRSCRTCLAESDRRRYEASIGRPVGRYVSTNRVCRLSAIVAIRGGR